jgi:hypothetical protein
MQNATRWVLQKEINKEKNNSKTKYGLTFGDLKVFNMVLQQRKKYSKCNSTIAKAIDFSKCLSLTCFKIAALRSPVTKRYLQLAPPCNVPLKGDDIYPFLTVTLKVLVKIKIFS